MHMYNIYIYIYTHMYIHMYTHTHAYGSFQNVLFPAHVVSDLVRTLCALVPVQSPTLCAFEFS